MAMISLDINNTLADCDKGHIEIRCAVDCNQIDNILKVFLKRSDEVVASVLDDGKFCNTDLTNQSGVTVNSLISNVSLSYLNIRKISSSVEPTKDEGPYQCFLEGWNADTGWIAENTSLKMLNIKGNMKYTLCL